jgi:hypothetical protein
MKLPISSFKGQVRFRCSIAHVPPGKTAPLPPARPAPVPPRKFIQGDPGARRHALTS